MRRANDIDFFVNHLTLRYDPRSPPTTYDVGPRDFRNKIDGSPEEVERLLKAAVDGFVKRARPQRIVVPLSSGIDSALILSIAKEVARDSDITALSMGFGKHDNEFDGAKAMAEQVGVKIETFNVDNPLRMLAHDIAIAESPKWNLYTARIFEYAKSVLHADAMFTGDGGDELFGGYIFRINKFVSNYWKPFDSPMTRAICYLDCHERDYIPEQETMFAKPARFSWNRIVNNISEFFRNDLLPLDQLFMADFNGKLQRDFLQSAKAFARYYELPTFSPMLDGRIVNYAFSLNPWSKFTPNAAIGKNHLTAILAARGLMEFVGKQKVGFGTDPLKLWKEHGRSMALSLMSHGGPMVSGEFIISDAWLGKMLDADITDLRLANRMLHILALEFYLRERKLLK
jgi:asparagine synthase (glutamine-hydrolysing)